MNTQNVCLLLIDPQYDFYEIPESLMAVSSIDENGNPVLAKPNLAIPGSWDDALRLSEFIGKNSSKINSIEVSFDTHKEYDIAHSLYWQDKEGKHPAPFTTITHEEIMSGKWTPVDRMMLEHALNYTKSLEDAGKYKLVIWPTHCVLGTPGHSVVAPIMNAINDWELLSKKSFTDIKKGTNPHTEHYGAFEAEYYIGKDESTHLNKSKVESVASHDMIIVSGQALSHCVAASVEQLADNMKPEDISKIVLLKDTTSPVDGFQKESDEFLERMVARGMRVETTKTLFL